jgi:hypothetical protein
MSGAARNVTMANRTSDDRRRTSTRNHKSVLAPILRDGRGVYHRVAFRADPHRIVSDEFKLKRSGDRPLLPLPACGAETSEARSWSVRVRETLVRLGLTENEPEAIML